jgi:hypothetical protein
LSRLKRRSWAVDRDGRVCLELTQGLATIVDQADLPTLLEHTWGAVNCSQRAHKKLYAYRWTRDSLGRRKKLYLHRFLMGDPQGLVVDHINGDSLDNRRENLRVVTHVENLAGTFFTKKASAEPFL